MYVPFARQRHRSLALRRAIDDVPGSFPLRVVPDSSRRKLKSPLSPPNTAVISIDSSLILRSSTALPGKRLVLEAGMPPSRSA